MRRILIALAAFAATLLPVSVQAQICAPFTDVLASNPFCGNIQWMLNRGVTSGCGTNLYCPHDFMPRDQMAAFMNRLADKVTFQQGGNAFAAAGELGTTDNHVLELIVNNSRVMRYEPNAISPNVIGGSPANSVTAGVRGATIAGGGVPAGNSDPDFGGDAPNRVTDAYGTVGGGYGNRAGDDAGTTVDRPFATVGGGVANTASGLISTVAGGQSNTASGLLSTVAGGVNNTASGIYSTVAGGGTNTASGPYSTVAGGVVNTASGDNSFAAGLGANADQPQCFMFANWFNGLPGSCLGWSNIARFQVNNGLAVDYHSRNPLDGTGNRWVHIGNVPASLTINTWTGAFLSDAGVWVDAVSSKEAKTDFAPVDAGQLLDKVAALPITTWRYREGEGDVRHIGPMAEDFHAAFGVGYGPRTIADLDARGVALAAIQGLNAKLEAKLAEKDAEIATLNKRLAELDRAVQRLTGVTPQR